MSASVTLPRAARAIDLSWERASMTMSHGHCLAIRVTNLNPHRATMRMDHGHRPAIGATNLTVLVKLIWGPLPLEWTD
jgi:hypothetical protein